MLKGAELADKEKATGFRYRRKRNEKRRNTDALQTLRGSVRLKPLECVCIPALFITMLFCYLPAVTAIEIILLKPAGCYVLRADLMSSLTSTASIPAARIACIPKSVSSN